MSGVSGVSGLSERASECVRVFLLVRPSVCLSVCDIRSTWCRFHYVTCHSMAQGQIDIIINNFVLLVLIACCGAEWLFYC